MKLTNVIQHLYTFNKLYSFQFKIENELASTLQGILIAVITTPELIKEPEWDYDSVTKQILLDTFKESNIGGEKYNAILSKMIEENQSLLVDENVLSILVNNPNIGDNVTFFDKPNEIFTIRIIDENGVDLSRLGEELITLSKTVDNYNSTVVLTEESTETKIENFLRYLIVERGLGLAFNIDDDLADYTDIDGNPVFNEEEIIEFNFKLDNYNTLAHENGLDIYDIANEINGLDGPEDDEFISSDMSDDEPKDPQLIEWEKEYLKDEIPVVALGWVRKLGGNVEWLTALKDLLISKGVDYNFFEKYLIKADQLTSKEIEDLDYVEDRIDTHLEDYNPIENEDSFNIKTEGEITALIVGDKQFNVILEETEQEDKVSISFYDGNNFVGDCEANLIVVSGVIKIDSIEWTLTEYEQEIDPEGILYFDEQFTNEIINFHENRD